MGKRKYLIIGKKYEIIHPCYDDYDEGLEPEAELIEVLQKNSLGYLVKNLDHGLIYTLYFSILEDCEINEMVI